MLLKKKEQKVKRNTIISYLLLGFGATFILSIIMTLFNPEPANSETPAWFPFVFSLSFIAAGIWVNRSAASEKHDAENYRKYLTLILNQDQTSLDYIASATGISHFTVEEDLQKMMSQGYFAGAYLNKEQREIVLPKKAKNPSDSQQVSTAEHTIICKGCGASNKVPEGKATECQYCRLPL
ncbi:MAG: hypothetical protein FWC86_03740 [Coriobacteriia bacterium]|nr:hypothetical protein [Coriobacteriia bacterium]